MTDTAPLAATPACARLAEALQDLKSRTGLSLTALAARTAYSKSSWARYLNGRQLAPRDAVEALCTMAGQPPGRLVALWELAELEWSGRHRTSGAPPPPDQPASGAAPADRPAHRWNTRRRRWALAAAACAVTVAAATWLTTSRGPHIQDTAGRTAPSAAPAAECRAQECTGQDPETMGCAAPGQAQRRGPPYRTRTGARLVIVLSTRCHAAWALAWNTRTGDAFKLSAPGGAVEQVKVADTLDAEDPLFTPMIGPGDLTGLRACFTPAAGKQECIHG
ncbi:helix-turn-helix domain-containing protein [Actinacidiphila paucisporea]|uniref:Helix-turn-helix domain-containing protein n=1 Tax=Actinacidiphila paucisporea TaxID=310782 RepID=A0A1M7Q8E6_9ACTN|nr:XRE family transcriptional regulator [Actinacidiphila paucisporea]SHN26905.1 Helix-turn-helix domain-containing protein [Actinacidiphila paucisporea]